jgi:hypothetical protein
MKSSLGIEAFDVSGLPFIRPPSGFIWLDVDAFGNQWLGMCGLSQRWEAVDALMSLPCLIMHLSGTIERQRLG